MHESHNMETLQRFPIGKLKRLHAKYKAKGTKEASREAANIKRMIVSRMNEAVSTNDPNRGRMGRKKPLVPQGMMPDETINPRTGNPVRTLGKLHSRIDQLSPETRKRYRQNYGYRTRVAGRGKRLYPMAEAETKKDKYEGQESTKSMIARLVAQRHRKLGMKVPTDVERDIDPKYKTDKD